MSNTTNPTPIPTLDDVDALILSIHDVVCGIGGHNCGDRKGHAYRNIKFSEGLELLSTLQRKFDML